MSDPIKSPFPWFGGKSRAAAQVWAALGDPATYVEPFAGSLAVLLARPTFKGRRAETVNDLDGMIANFWRSLTVDPEAVVRAADWPVVQVDMRARWDELERRRATTVDNLRADPKWCDPEAAGWWVWGQCSAVGANWLHGYEARPQVTQAKAGVNAVDGLERLRECADRMRQVGVWCCDWSLTVTDAALGDKSVGIFLDPPYADTRVVGCYREDSTTVYADVTRWAADANPDWRIVIAGFDGEHNDLEARGWTRRNWSPPRGMESRAPDGRGAANKGREVLWCSPSCVPEANVQVSLFGAA